MNDKNLFVPFEVQGSTLKKRRHLPHWEQLGATFFVTFRTADSLPTAKLRLWKEESRIWLNRHPRPWPSQTALLHHQLFEGRVQAWLDRNHGACPFRSGPNAKIVMESLRSFDTSRYILDRFAILPNHVHAILKPLSGYRLSAILHSWKSFSALRINRLTGRTGQLWMDESFDHIVRSWQSLEEFRDYITENPRKAGLRNGEFILGQGKGLVREE